MQSYYDYTKKTLLLNQEIIKIMNFRQKQKQIESNLKNQFKQSVKSKIPQLKSKLTKNAQLENNKTYTIKPSYIDLQQKLYQQMKQNLHMIVNKSSFMALRKQIKSQNFKTTEQPEKLKLSSINPKQVFHNIHNAVAKQEGETYAVKITGGKQNENSLTQLWAFVADQLHSNSVYIHHIESNLAIKILNEKVVLAPKEKTKDFMFTLKTKAGVKSLYEHSISILSALNGKALALKGILCLNQPNPKDQCQEFYLRKIGLYQPIKLKDTFILSNPKDKGLYCLSATRDKQQILYQKMDYSLEQRWKFSPSIVSREDKVIVMGRGKQIDMINEQDIKIGQSRNTLNQRKSKLEELNPYQINLVTKAAKNLIEEYDNDCCEIINLKLEKSLVLRDFKGTQRLAFVSKSQRREWKVQCDGYSMKIKHFQKEEYLGLDNGLVALSKEPHYWEVVQSYQNKLQKSSQIVDFKSQKFNSPPHNFVKQ